jgi:hypothetical protein
MTRAFVAGGSYKRVAKEVQFVIGDEYVGVTLYRRGENSRIRAVTCQLLTIVDGLIAWVRDQIEVSLVPQDGEVFDQAGSSLGDHRFQVFEHISTESHLKYGRFTKAQKLAAGGIRIRRHDSGDNRRTVREEEWFSRIHVALAARPA